jgi:hypothetical protein
LDGEFHVLSPKSIPKTGQPSAVRAKAKLAARVAAAAVSKQTIAGL